MITIKITPKKTAPKLFETLVEIYRDGEVIHLSSGGLAASKKSAFKFALKKADAMLELITDEFCRNYEKWL